MPNGQPNASAGNGGRATPFEFEDKGTRYAIDVDRETDSLRVRVASNGVGATFPLSILGAQRFSMQLSAALTSLINHH